MEGVGPSPSGQFKSLVVAIRNSNRKSQLDQSAQFGELNWGCSMTPHPNTSLKASRYKWEPYRDTSWWCTYYFQPRASSTCFCKVSRQNRDGRCTARLFQSTAAASATCRTEKSRHPDNSRKIQNPLDRGQSRKIRFSKFPGSGLKKI